MTTTPKDFVELWAKAEARENQAAQTHFNMLCQLVGHPTPIEADPQATFFTFEENVQKATGGRGRADVWYQGHFAWEYKGKHKDLDAAYSQVLAYRGALDNPPLLVVCDFLEYRIYPQWENMSGLPFVFRNEDLLERQYQNYIRWLLESPEKFREERQADLAEREKLTLELARKFAHLADIMRQHEGGKWDTMQIARFLTKLVFALFAQDIDLMPRPLQNPVFHFLTHRVKEAPGEFPEYLQKLFEAMDGRIKPPDNSHVSTFLFEPVPYFNGGLFADSTPGANDGLEVLDLTEIESFQAIDLLIEVNEANWRNVNPTIFGNLFEGALDPNKRSQLGAHYTSEADIRLIVDPVLMEPLNREWTQVLDEAEPLMQIHLNGDSPRDTQNAYERLVVLHDQMMNRLENTTVLDPACGSGNFLYVSLRAMKDLEGKVRKFFEPLGLPFRDVVTPRQLYGIEKDVFAAKLAHVVVWIGYLQWRYEDEGGILHPRLKKTSRPHPRELPHPILRDKLSSDEPDRIQNRDSILDYDADGNPIEPAWQAVDVIMGNPPFLGDKRMRSELSDGYVDQLRELYGERIPGQSDLVCYWFERARTQLEKKLVKRAGLLATNSIRSGANRAVLERIKQTGNIFMAWGDRPWLLEGASVRISLVGFDGGTETEYMLDGAPVHDINADLQNTIDATAAKLLKENADLAFIGVQKGGDFDIPAELAQSFIQADPKNKEVVRPWVNAMDLVGRNRNMWIINFADMSLEKAKEYKEPFQYLFDQVKPIREKNRDQRSREYWWQLQRSRPMFYTTLGTKNRYIITPRVAKHRVFIWIINEVIPDTRTVAIARDDDYFFGVLHSYIHEAWSIRLASWHGVGNDPTYNAESCFETFPFPWSPGSEPAAHPHYAAISAAAVALHAERGAWLNPDEAMLNGLGAGDQLSKRTLTNLYNALEEYRARQNGNGSRSKPSPAAAFAPRLDELHRALDAAVLAAYGWDDLLERLRTAEGDEELLRRLLALNLERAEG